MLKILESMGEDEILSIRDRLDPENLYPKLQELQNLAENHCIFDGLENVLAFLEDCDHSEGDDAEDDDGDEREDEGQENGEEND